MSTAATPKVEADVLYVGEMREMWSEGNAATSADPIPGEMDIVDRDGNLVVTIRCRSALSLRCLGNYIVEAPRVRA